MIVANFKEEPWYFSLRWVLALWLTSISASQNASGQLQSVVGAPQLAGTQAFEPESLAESQDIAEKMLDGIDQFLLLAIERSRQERWLHWQELTNIIQRGLVADSSSLPSDYLLWIEQKRASLRECLGIRDQREPVTALEILHTTHRDGVVGRGDILRNYPNSSAGDFPAGDSVDALQWQATAVRWPVLKNVDAEGLLIEPTLGAASANFIVLPDADQTPEQLVGLVEGLPVSQQTARILATAGCRVLVPMLISRTVEARGPPGEAGRAELSHREFVYRPAFELGRHIIGYEVQKVLAAVDWLSMEGNAEVGVVGYGEGGLIALCSAALDDRIQSTLVRGAFGPREGMWREPICRNLFGFLKHFGDAELAALVWPRSLVVDFSPGPNITLRTRGGAPGELIPHSLRDATSEFRRAADILGIDLREFQPDTEPPMAAALGGPYPAGKAAWIFSDVDSPAGQLDSAPVPQVSVQDRQSSTDESSADQRSTDENWVNQSVIPTSLRCLLWPKQAPVVPMTIGVQPDAATRQRRQLDQLIEHTQFLLAESAKHRDRLLHSLDTSSIDNYRECIQFHRKRFYEDVIGRFDEEFLPPNAKSRVSWQTDQWTGHEVILDVWPNVLAYGVLLIPNDIAAGDKRPVVVCQHGLEGRPTDVFLGDHPAYHDFAAKLCERGYIVFAPQNPYLMQDKFRTLQRKANSIGKTLFSIMIPQHQQILRWLKTLPQVDSDRIAFYGLSYGGKSAMRIPAVLEDYCLSICSADFNEWIIKNASTRDGFSYVWTGEYEIFEYNLGNTFGYAEMAGLICPRPFMVERGHFDAVATDQWVGFEYAKVRNLYQARLGIGHMTEIEWFAGPHTINGKGTFDFLDRHMRNSQN